MAESDKSGADENTFIKAYDEMEKSRTPIRGTEAFPLLEIVQGPKAGAWFTVAYQKEITLGRAATNSILLEDNSVSRSHTVLQASGSGFTVRDIGSRNGTFVNGKKIQGEVELHHKDLIKIGIYTLRYLQEATEEEFEMEREEMTPRLEETAAAAASGVPEEHETGAAIPAVISEAAESPEEAGAGEARERAMGGGGEKSINEDLQEIMEGELPPVAPLEKTAVRSFKSLGILLLVLLVFGGGGYAAYRFGALEKLRTAFQGKGAPKGEIAGKTQAPPKVLTPQLSPPEAGENVPIFLEVDSQPIPAKVFYRGKELGTTPFKISIQAPVGKPQELRAELFLEGLKEKFTDTQNFDVKQQDESVNVQFKPKLGTLNIMALPRDGQLYLEGKYAGTGEAGKSFKITEVSFDTPVHLPYGKYVAEIRIPEQLEGSATKVDAIKYRREFEIGEKSLTFSVEASDEAIKTFPAEIASQPSGAELLVDGKRVGDTPFKGNLPTGRHQLVLKKEGFNEFQKEVIIELNTPYVANFNMMTSPAGEYINRGRDLLKKQQFNESIAQLAEALKRNPEPTEISQIHMLLGEAFLQNKTFDQALAYYQRAGQSPEYEKRARLGMAEAQSGLGQKDQALIQILDVYMTTKDEKLKSQAESAYHKIYPMKSVLYVATQPVGAQITVNGNLIAQPTPVILSDLMVGSYRINIQKPGFKAFETRVTLPMSGIKPVVVTLDPE